MSLADEITDEDVEASSLADEITDEDMAQAGIVNGPSKKQSFIKGVQQGGTLGFADELAGAASVLGNKIAKYTSGLDAEGRAIYDIDSDGEYSQGRDQARAETAAAEAANPGYFTAGAFTGSLPTMAIPGMNPATGGIAKAAQAGAISGAATGLGGSEADLTRGKTLDAVKDTATGAVIGGGAGALGAAALKGVSALNDRRGKIADYLLKKVGKAGANVPEEVTERYLARSGAINAVDEADDMASRFINDELPAYKMELQSAWSQAKSKLGSQPAIAKSDVAQMADDLVGEILAGPQKNLSRTAAGGDEGVAIASLQKEMQKILSGQRDVMSQADLGQAVKNLQDLAYTMRGNPELAPSATGIRKLSGILNERLKAMNPEYAEAMLPVQQATEALSSVERQLVNPQNTASIDKFTQGAKRFGRSSEKSDLRSAVSQFDKVSGGDLGDRILDRNAADILQRGDTQGSRKTIFGGIAGRLAGGTIGGALGYETGSFGGDQSAGAGALAGAGAGFFADRAAGPIFKALLNSRISVGEGTQYLSQRFGKYAAPLAKAASRGVQALTTTQFLLQKTDPKFRQLMQQQR